jgi:tetratricopeptide (TPR) repeat protein
VTIEGQALDKGTYGLHMIPGQDQWVVIFSKANAAWGSFTYKESEDALRVNVKPQAAELQDALSYDFDQLGPNSAVISMRWEKVAVPFKVGVNVDDIVQNSLHTQLRGLAQYTWDGWDDAANYLLTHKLSLDDALRYEEQSLQIEERFENRMSKSRILEAMGKQEEAKAERDKALAKASPQQLHGYAFQLLGAKKQQEALEVWKTNAKNHPELWFTHAGMARVYSAQGDFASALKEEKIAEAGAPDSVKLGVQRQIKRLEAKEDINQ